jgi:hypothetical protein
MAELSSISQKIRKLLALADGNRNEHERDAAMRLAMDLLSKHNLDLASIGTHASESDVEEVQITLKLEPWIRSVLHAVCKLYYTEFFMRAVFRGTYRVRKEWHPTFVGTSENINVTLEVAAWLLASIRAESNFLFVEPYARRSFRLGAAHRLAERAIQMIEQEKNMQSGNKKNSLMLVRNELEKANRAHLEKKKMGTFQARVSYLDGEAYGMGESFADSVNLGKKKAPQAISMRSTD